MSRLPMLRGRVPTAAARVLRPEDLSSVAEALYEESLSYDAGSMVCEPLDLHADRTGQNTVAATPSQTRSAIVGLTDAHGRRGHDTGMLY